MGSSPGRLKVAVALSGGVDSAAAAAVLRDDGFEVTGLTMRLPAGEGAVEAAASVARALGMPLEVIDVDAEFERLVIAPFAEGYLGGLTPNPCVECNRSVKFGILLDAALQRGCSALATGHYARLEGGDGGRYRMFRGVDVAKDQSYVLWTLGQQTLGKVRFPLGRMTKEEASLAARAAGVLETAPESQDICFFSSGSYADLVAKRSKNAPAPGPIVDREGRALGEHRGLEHYTVGQRRGLGLGGPRPLFVLELRPEENTLVVGDREAASCDGFAVEGLSFTSGEEPESPVECLVQTRYRGQALSASLALTGERRGRVSYAAPGPPAAPGQSAVFYLDDELIGGGLISRP